MSGNLTVPDTLTTAVHITADNVTLDLNGFSIIGPAVCTPNPTTCTASAECLLPMQCEGGFCCEPAEAVCAFPTIELPCCGGLACMAGTCQ